MTWSHTWRAIVSILMVVIPLYLMSLFSWKMIVILTILSICSFGLLPIGVFAAWVFVMVAIWDPILDL